MAKRKKKTTKKKSDPLAVVETALLDLPAERAQLPDAREALAGVADSARDAEQRDIAGLADTLGELIELLETQLDTEDVRSDDLLNLLRGGLNPLRDGLADVDGAAESIERFLESAREEWGDYLSEPDGLVSQDDDAWQDALGETEDVWCGDDEHTPTLMMGDGLGDILASIRGSKSTQDDDDDDDDVVPDVDATDTVEEESDAVEEKAESSPVVETNLDVSEDEAEEEPVVAENEEPAAVEDSTPIEEPKAQDDTHLGSIPAAEPKLKDQPDKEKEEDAFAPTLLVGSQLGDILPFFNKGNLTKKNEEKKEQEKTDEPKLSDSAALADTVPQPELEAAPEAPAVKEPVADAPVAEAPVAEEPATEEPVGEEQAADDSVKATPEAEANDDAPQSNEIGEVDSWSDAEDQDDWNDVESDVWDDAIISDDDPWNEADDSWADEADNAAPAKAKDDGLGDILKALVGAATSPPAAPESAPAPPPAPTYETVFAATSTGGVPGDAPPAQQIEMDAELLEAFLDDASAGNGRLEQIVLKLESNPADAAAHQEICRELHTLKGASASVGLSTLAGYLHEVEDYVQGLGGESVDVSPLLKAVDAVRLQIEALTGGGSSESTGEESSGPSMSFTPTGSDREESLRVKASRVDRLMDLLAELVTLRNQRDSRLARLKNLRAELTRCSSRLRAFTGGTDDDIVRTIDGTNELTAPSNSVVEIAHDIAEFTRTLDGIAEPMEAESIAISQFTRQFRQELMEMRRLSVAGLFQRLNRSAQDAARVEGKRMQFVLEGEHSGLDRSLQERLYEPLLHIVRNAVSHGIEPEAERKAAGKPDVGTITLSAKGGPTTLVIEISDDGRGLNYEAIRAKAMDKGLIAIGENVSEARLARLIFHPGFSTRKQTTEISGRGVGMDVVAAALQRIRAKIDIDSRPGLGTTMRLTIPLRSVIEHAMTIRVDGRLYALPMQFVQAAGPASNLGANDDPDSGAFPTIRLRRLLGESTVSVPEDEQLVLLGSGRLTLDGGNNAGTGVGQFPQIFGLIVDAVVGPEEIVVRNLPPLLKSHPLLGGVSLSGAGEAVMMLDGQRLLDTAVSAQSTLEKPANNGSATNGDTTKSTTNAVPVLVVDDSMSARRRLIGYLNELGLESTEASDGLDGLDRFRGQRYPIVFTDIEMPRLDGLGLLGEIKRSSGNNPPRVVVVSSRTEEEYRRRARELGADGYLVKPVDKSALYSLLESLPTASTNGGEG